VNYTVAPLQNISNIFVICGLIYGAPQRQNPGNWFLYDSGSQWSIPLYSCASAMKATIKTISLSYNGTEPSLANLVVTKIQDKIYSDDQTLPLWGEENGGAGGYTIDVLSSPVWGLVADEFANHPNVSTVRRASLYLPGESGVSLPTIGNDFIAGAEAFQGAWQIPYSQSADGIGTAPSPIDYTGSTDIGMLVRWQELSSSASSVSQIPNLIWTDIVAQAVVGTKGVLGSLNNASENIIPISVIPTVSRVEYNWPYAVPALLAALLLLLINIGIIITMLFGNNSIAKLRLHLQRLAPGRIFTTFLYPEEHNGMIMSSKQWAETAGKTAVDLSGECPSHVGVGIVAESGKLSVVSENKPSGPTHHLDEVEEHGDEEGNDQGNGQTDGLEVRQRFLGDRS
jgi:hypothetical protein